jgi:hypothetical protein
MSSDITLTLHYRDVRRLLNALRRFPVGEYAPVEEQQYTWELVGLLTDALGEERDF